MPGIARGGAKKIQKEDGGGQVSGGGGGPCKDKGVGGEREALEATQAILSSFSFQIVCSAGHPPWGRSHKVPNQKSGSSAAPNVIWFLFPR